MGKMLASEYDNIRPDTILLGKALSGGGKWIIIYYLIKSDSPYSVPHSWPTKIFH